MATKQFPRLHNRNGTNRIVVRRIKSQQRKSNLDTERKIIIKSSLDYIELVKVGQVERI